MTCRAAFLSLLLALAPGLAAASDPQSLARRAAQRLDAAARGLAEAETARDRVAALTRTVRAYEEGLTALREGLRRAAAREAEIRAEFDRESQRLGQLVGALQAMRGEPEALLLLHPDGPVGTARSGMLLGAVTPAVLTEVEALKARLDEIVMLRALQSDSAETLVQGREAAQQARAALSQAIAQRRDTPRRLTEDPQAVARLAQGAQTLQGFAEGLSRLPLEPAAAPAPDFAEAKGALAMPVRGRVLHRFRARDAAGIRRPGWVVETAPGALVTTPWPATIRYLGPLLDYANVMILEPGPGYLMVLAGLDSVYGRVGDILPGGAPVGAMAGALGGEAAANGAAANGAVDADGDRPTLYLELRQGSQPMDPAGWFVLDEE